MGGWTGSRSCCAGREEGERHRGRRDPNPVCPGVAGRFLWLSGLQDLGRKLWGGLTLGDRQSHPGLIFGESVTVKVGGLRAGPEDSPGTFTMPCCEPDTSVSGMWPSVHSLCLNVRLGLTRKTP